MLGPVKKYWWPYYFLLIWPILVSEWLIRASSKKLIGPKHFFFYGRSTILLLKTFNTWNDVTAWQVRQSLENPVFERIKRQLKDHPWDAISIDYSLVSVCNFPIWTVAVGRNFPGPWKCEVFHRLCSCKVDTTRRNRRSSCPKDSYVSTIYPVRFTANSILLRQRIPCICMMMVPT